MAHRHWTEDLSENGYVSDFQQPKVSWVKNPVGTEYSIAGSAASSAASAWSWQQPGRSSAASSTSWQKIDEDSDPNDPGWEAKDEELYTKQPTTPSAAPTFNVMSISDDRTLRRLPGTPVIDTTDSFNKAVMPTQALTTTRDDETNATLQNTIVTTECIAGKWYKNYTTYSADGIRDENGDRRVIETFRKEIAPSATAQVAPSNERPSSATCGPIQFVREGHVKPIVPLTADQKWERALLQQRKEEAAKHERTTSAYEDALYERDRARRYAEIAEEAAKAPAPEPRACCGSPGGGTQRANGEGSDKGAWNAQWASGDWSDNVVTDAQKAEHEWNNEEWDRNYAEDERKATYFKELADLSNVCVTFVWKVNFPGHILSLPEGRERKAAEVTLIIKEHAAWRTANPKLARLNDEFDEGKRAHHARIDAFKEKEAEQKRE